MIPVPSDDRELVIPGDIVSASGVVCWLNDEGYPSVTSSGREKGTYGLEDHQRIDPNNDRESNRFQSADEPRCAHQG